MQELSDLTIYTATDGERWIAATSSSPYLCLEAASEREALELAARALRFRQNAAQAAAERAAGHQGREPSFPGYRIQNRVSLRELAIAYW
jgi:hypothetical protein